jgi:hypothetical protein
MSAACRRPAAPRRRLRWRAWPRCAAPPGRAGRRGADLSPARCSRATAWSRASAVVGGQLMARRVALAVVQGQVEQHQVAQAVFAGALAGQAAVGQRQGGVADPQQAAACALGHADAARAGAPPAAQHARSPSTRSNPLAWLAGQRLRVARPRHSYRSPGRSCAPGARHPPAPSAPATAGSGSRHRRPRTPSRSRRS